MVGREKHLDGEHLQRDYKIIYDCFDEPVL